MTNNQVYIHYTPQHVWEHYEIKILCGAVFTEGVTNSEGAVTCPVCIKMLSKPMFDEFDPDKIRIDFIE